MILLQILFAATLGYLFGAIPFAFLVYKYFHGGDIRTLGTGNVGAMNTYDVSGKRRLGILVGLLDVLKGAAAVGVSLLINDEHFLVPGVAGYFALTGHNYNYFLDMKGGIGLAVIAGALLVINPLGVFFFVLMYFTVYFAFKRDIHVSIVGGVMGTVLLGLSAPKDLLYLTSNIPMQTEYEIRILLFLVAAQVSIRCLPAIRAKFGKPQDISPEDNKP
jgi:glycerol-3-phosphate acyltransferase PlsY